MSKGAGYLARERCLAEYHGRGDIKFFSGTHTNVAASDTVVVDAGVTLLAVFATQVADQAATASVAGVSCDVGDQAGSPAKGSFLLKSWEADGTAATSFGDDIQWFALGY